MQHDDSHELIVFYSHFVWRAAAGRPRWAGRPLAAGSGRTEVHERRNVFMA